MFGFFGAQPENQPDVNGPVEANDAKNEGEVVEQVE